MTKKLSGLLLTCLFFLTFQLTAQTSEYPVKNIKGIDYYIYTVQPSEGLLAIGRKFEVSATEITKLNPEIQSGLKPGQEILIPIHKKVGLPTKTEFLKHTVEKKQTLFAISHKYNVSQEDIEKLNPEVRNGGLKEGMILNIPLKMKLTESQSVVKSAIPVNSKPAAVSVPATNLVKDFITHKVQSKETLFSISKQYNVDSKEVVKLNPGADIKISVGSELKIPVANSKIKPKSESTKSVEKTLISSATEVKQAEKQAVKEEFTEQKVIKIAFLLPFMLEQAKKDAVLERFQNFYAGALMAVQAAKERGISFDIFTYDTDKTEEKMTEVLSNEELKTMDLIIGPAFSNQIPLMGNFANENKVNTLIPFSSKVPDIENNPYLFQFNPGFDAEIKYLVDQFNGNLKNTHVVFAEIQGVNPADEGKIREGVLKNQLIKQHKSSGVIELNSPENANFSSQLKTGEKNLIIFNTDKFSSVSPYLSALSLLSADYNVVLYEQFSWRNQIEKKPDCLFISPFMTTQNEDFSAEYNSRFDQYFGKDVSNDSPRYDMLGFDLTNYFISYIHKFGNKYVNKIGSLNNLPFIQSQLNFERISKESGFVNQTLYTGETKAH